MKFIDTVVMLISYLVIILTVVFTAVAIAFVLHWLFKIGLDAAFISGSVLSVGALYFCSGWAQSFHEFQDQMRFRDYYYDDDEDEEEPIDLTTPKQKRNTGRRRKRK